MLMSLKYSLAIEIHLPVPELDCLVVGCTTDKVAKINFNINSNTESFKPILGYFTYLMMYGRVGCTSIDLM